MVVTRISVAATKSRLLRAMKILRKALVADPWEIGSSELKS
jgi:hypothetical protein